MRYREYTNKTSLSRRNSRLVKGGKTEVSGNKLGWWERKNENFQPSINDELTYTIPIDYQFRPDLIAFLMYGTTELEWVILQYNNIVDIIEQFAAGREIKLPSPDYVRNYVYSRT